LLRKLSAALDIEIDVFTVSPSAESQPRWLLLYLLLNQRAGASGSP
jgi:hypothetical protein